MRRRPAETRRAAEQAGRAAEDAAAAWLAAYGWLILDRRARGRRGDGAGEIDLVALDRSGTEPVVVFVEVKARPTVEAALSALTPAQRRRLAVAAEGWLAAHPAFAEAGVRFDVIAVAGGGAPAHLPDAWRPEA
jgi:putative endonuclease